MQLASAFVAGLLAFGPALSSVAQEPHFKLGPREGETSFGSAVGVFDDLDRDGVPEFGVSGLRRAAPPKAPEAFTRVYSGATGTPLREFAGELRAGDVGDFDGDGLGDPLLSGSVRSSATGQPLFQMAVSPNYGPIGDFDGDGLSDFLAGQAGVYIVSCAGDSATVGDFGIPGQAFVYASSIGLARVVTGPDVGGATGGFLGELGDVDRDGAADYLVGATTHHFAWSCLLTLGTNLVTAYSGRDGAPLWTWTAPLTASLALEDVNGDGIPDWAAGLAGQSVVQIRSGADGSVLAFTDDSDLPDPGSNVMGDTLERVPDLDGDRLGDLAVGLRQDPVWSGLPARTGRVRLVSSADATTLGALSGRLPGERYGASIASLPDLDGDGFAELLIGAPGPFGFSPGRAEVVSLRQVLRGRIATRAR